MTWRAFLIGLVGVLWLSLLTPVNDYRLGNTFLTGNHFPVGAFFFLLALTLGVNVGLKLLRRGWALRQSELMLVWCMMLMSATVPASGLMRYWFPTAAAAPYLAGREDLFWEDTVLKEAPEGILLSKDVRSPAARRFYDGTPLGEAVRVPWGQWKGVIVTWGIFIWLYYLATFFLLGILRRQWVEAERLTFAVARVPLELTEGSEGPALLPPLVRSKAFLVGAAVTVAFGLLRVSPVFFGAEEGWRLRLPVSQIFAGTPWWRTQIEDGWIFPIGIGFAFLVPADVSLGLWLFYLFTCAELQTAYYLGRPLPGGPWGPFLYWQQAGAFMAFTAALLWMSRRHLAGVARAALGLRGGADSLGEPVRYPLAFWGLLACMAGMMAWYVHFGLRPWVAAALLCLVLSIVLVHARLVAQGGLFFTQQSWSPPDILHGVTGGTAFSGAAAVVAQAQHAILLYDAREILSPHAMNALRISSAFERHRRWFLPAMLVALAVAMAASGYSTLRWVYYDIGALNSRQPHSVMYYPTQLFNKVHGMISSPSASARPQWLALGMGGGLMLCFSFLRHVFYWWPVHPLGFLVASSWCMRQLWFSFLVGWLTKICVLKLGGAGALRAGRSFFLGVIVAETAVAGACTFVSLLTGVRIGYVFLSS